MLIQVLEGFNERMLQALNAGNYDEIRVLDSACLRYMSDHLSPTDMGEEDMLKLKECLERLQNTYRQAIQACQAVKEEVAQELHKIGKNRNSTVQYLNVARNMGP